MLWILLVVYQIKHFLADYPLQGKFMLGKFAKFPDFVLPLLAHVGVHGLFTFLIAISLKPFKVAAALAVLDMVVHFVVDRIKASPDLLGRFKAISKQEYMEQTQMIASLEQAPVPRHPEIELALKNAKSKFSDTMKSNTYFWWSLGWDQMMHHLTHYLIIWALLP
jgi:hypothetical protein